MTVLYRAHYITRSIEEQLLKAEIPYTIYSGVQFFARREIKDALSYLRLLAYRDDLSLLRVVNVPKRNIGQRRRKFLTEYAEEHGLTLYEAMQASIEDPIWKGTQARAFLKLVDDLAEVSTGASVSEVLAEVLDRSGYEAMLRTEAVRRASTTSRSSSSPCASTRSAAARRRGSRTISPMRRSSRIRMRVTPATRFGS